MNKYRLVAKKGEGTFSEVLKAQCIKNGKYVAIKCMKNHFDSLDQVNNLREIQALRRLSPHPHIIKLLEVLYDQPTGRLALVFELMDINMYELIRGRRHYVAEERVRSYMYQLMKALDHMHRNGIFHRDIKPENILITDDVLKLADFGSCRGIYSKQPYTEYISTRWYRAPECLLTDGYYNYKMDMWGVGCVMFEIVALYPLFPGNNELDQIQKIHATVGTPPPELLARLKKRSTHTSSFDFPPCQGSGLAKMLAHVPPDCADLIAKLLAYNPDERLSARQALRHPYFRERREADKRAKAAIQPDIVGSSYLAAMDSEFSTQQPQQQAAGALRHTESGDLSDAAAGMAGAAPDLQQDAAAGPSSMRHNNAGVAANAAAAAGVAGVLTEHLAAVAAAAAAAVAAAAAATGGGAGKDPGGSGAHGMMLPSINNSSSNGGGTKPQPQHHGHTLPARLPGQQQQQRQRQQQPHATHHGGLHPQQQPLQHKPSHHLQQQQQQQQQQQSHSLQPSQQLRPQQQGHAQQQLEGLQGHQLLAGLGSHSRKDREGSSLRQLMAEASSLSQAGTGLHGQALGLQASLGSLWQEGSGVGLGGGQVLPPLGSKGASGSGAQQSARRSSHLGQGSSHQQQQPLRSMKQQQHASHPGVMGGTTTSSSSKALASERLASKAGMLQEQQQQQQQQLMHARSGHHGMQISSGRYHKQSSMNGALQPAGSLGSSMSNLSSLQLGSKRTGAASAVALLAGGADAAKTLSAAASGGGGGGGGGRGPGSQYVSPYGQQRR